MDTIGFIFSLIGILPLLIGGIALICLSKKLKKNDGKRKALTNPLAHYAKVIDVQTDDDRDEEGYLRSRWYNITVEYEKNNELMISTIRSRYDYPTGMEVEIRESGSVYGAYIVGNPPQGMFTRNKTENWVKGYQIARIAGIILTVISSLFFLSQIPIVNDIIGYLLIIGFIGLPALGGFKIHSNYKKRQKDISNGLYEKFDAKIIDVKLEYSDDHKRYCPIVEIDYNGKIYTPQLGNLNTHINQIGQTIPIYIHKKTQKMILETEKDNTIYASYILYAISGIIALVFLLSAL